jgi:ATP-binding cassette subfamily B protein RaxB
MRENGWRNRYADVISASYRADIYGIQLGLAESILFGLQFLVIVYLGAHAVIGQEMTVGLLLAFVAYRTSFTGSATAPGGAGAAMATAGGPSRPPVRHCRQPREELKASPRVKLFRRLPFVRIARFSYGPNETPIFEKLDFEIPKGAFAAIIGPSGGGKTTLMRIMLGLLPPTSGHIMVDDAPLGPATNAAWRGRLGAVLQDDHLLTGTLADTSPSSTRSWTSNGSKPLRAQPGSMRTSRRCR